MKPGRFILLIGSVAIANLSSVAVAQDCPYPMIKQNGVCTVGSALPLPTLGPSLGDVTIPTIETPEAAVAVPAAPAAVAEPAPAPARAVCRYVDEYGNERLADC